MTQENTSEPIILLADNGSTRVDAAVQLRKIAQKLSHKTKHTVHPVSLQHSDSIPKEEVDQKLSGTPAQVFSDFMTEKLKNKHRDFILIPLFFGKSRAITSFVPQEMALLNAKFGDINLSICDVLYPLPNGDPTLIEILYQHSKSSSKERQELSNLVLVDHGSPLPAVNEVRQHISCQLKKKLPKGVQINQAAMERRKGKAYDFNGELLEDYLHKLAKSGETHARVLLLFLLPGTHAGENGDIAQICHRVMAKYSGFQVTLSPLIGENDLLIDCLRHRLEQAINP